jgi:curved DNA-binding protein CbpA
MADPFDPYKVLQVDPEAEDEVIQAAYRRLARKYHPDLAKSPDAADRMARINAAWEMIGETPARAAYDDRRARDAAGGGPPADRQERPTAAADGAPGPAAPQPGPTTRSRSAAPPPPETVSRDWTSGRSSHGGGYTDSMRTKEGTGAAGPPPGEPSGSVLNFGRYAGWSLAEVARHDLEYIEWLDRAPIGRNYRHELDGILRAAGRRRSADADADVTDRRGLYRRR